MPVGTPIPMFQLGFRLTAFNDRSFCSERYFRQYLAFIDIFSAVVGLALSPSATGFTNHNF